MWYEVAMVLWVLGAITNMELMYECKWNLDWVRRLVTNKKWSVRIWTIPLSLLWPAYAAFVVALLLFLVAEWLTKQMFNRDRE